MNSIVLTLKYHIKHVYTFSSSVTMATRGLIERPHNRRAAPVLGRSVRRTGTACVRSGSWRHAGQRPRWWLPTSFSARRTVSVRFSASPSQTTWGVARGVWRARGGIVPPTTAPSDDSEWHTAPAALPDPGRRRGLKVDQEKGINARPSFIASRVRAEV